jgi:hypothetical protein
MLPHYNETIIKKEDYLMKTVRISLNSIDKVKSFVNDLVRFTDVDFDLVSGRYVIDAKSIMGIFSLDLSKPIDLNIHADEDKLDEIVDTLKPYIIEA